MANLECNAVSAVQVTHLLLTRMRAKKLRGCFVYTSSGGWGGRAGRWAGSWLVDLVDRELLGWQEGSSCCRRCRPQPTADRLLVPTRGAQRRP